MEIRTGVCLVDGTPFTWEFCGGDEKRYCSTRCYNTAKGRRQRKRTAGLDWTVYGLADPRTGLFFYCGRTKNLAYRTATHKSISASHSTNVAYREKMADLQKAGIPPTVTVLEITKDSRRENFYITELRKAGHPMVNLYQG